MKTTALLTGASGKVGKYVIGALSRRGIEVVATDLVSSSIPPETRFEPCDLTDANAVLRLVARVKPDVVVHCAAVVAPIAYAEPERAEALNLGGTQHLIDATRSTRPTPSSCSCRAARRSALAARRIRIAKRPTLAGPTTTTAFRSSPPKAGSASRDCASARFDSAR